MKTQSTLLALAILSTAPFVQADEIHLKDGSLIKGKITSLAGGEFTVDSASAGTVKVKKDEVITFITDEEISLATAGGTEVKGKVVGTADGVSIAGPDGTVTSSIANLSDVWAPGVDSPSVRAVKAREHRWEYSVDFAASGKTGNGDGFGTQTGLSAINKGPEDDLKFYLKHEYAKGQATGSPWVTTANNLHAGVEYNNYFARPVYWYVRSDNGYDRVQQMSFFSTDAVGLGNLFIDKTDQHLSARVGISYRYASYRNNVLEQISSPGLDVGLHHDIALKWFTMVNDLTYTPAFENFGIYLITHDSHIDMPLAATESWKLRLGLSNQYNSRPAPGLQGLDSSYYMKFVYNWK